MTTLSKLHTSSWKKKLFEELFVKSWWVYLFIVLNVVGFNFGYKQLEAKQIEIMHSLTELSECKDGQKELEKELLFRIQSLKDPDSVELILKEEFGMISEGQTKVHFISPN